MMGSKFIEQSFVGSCWIIVGFMIGYWFYKYEVEDRDIGIVDYIPLEDANDIEFPMVTLCLVQPFIEKAMKEIDVNVNSTVYQEYLKGNIFEERLYRIDFDKVTMNISNYFIDATEEGPHDSISNQRSTLELKDQNTFSLFNSRDENVKCFPLLLNLPTNGLIQGVSLSFDKSSLLTDWENSLKPKTEFCLKPHYPGQFFLGPKPDCWPWMLVKSIKDITIKIEELEVIKRRNSMKKLCEDNSNVYDHMLLERHRYLNGCRNPSDSTHYSYPICNSTKKISESVITYATAKSISVRKPCNRISAIRYTLPNNEKHLTGTHQNGSFMIRMEYPDEIKVIAQVKEVDIHTLIGNIGGYFGLFLGKCSIYEQILFIIFQID